MEESYEIPEIDFGSFSLSLSPVQISVSEALSQERDAATNRPSGTTVNSTQLETLRGISVTQTDRTLPAFHSELPRYSARDTSHNVDFNNEDEDLQRAIALSKQTAEEEEMLRYSRIQRSGDTEFRVPGSMPRDFTPPTYVDATIQISPLGQTSSQPRLQTLDLQNSRETTAISPLSTASYGTDDATAIRRSISRPSRAPSTQSRLIRTPMSTSPPLDLPRSPPTLVVPNSIQERRSSQSSGKLSIRDTSRSRSGSNAARSTKSGSGELCAVCQSVDPANAYCNVCQAVYCEGCWAMMPPHRRNTTVGELPHEKTDQYIAKKVREVLTPDLDDNQRERLHEQDIDTTWFGVVREGHELPLFRDYGRYAALISIAKDIRMDLTDSSSVYSDQSETLYPSLVSFVGETGAGKSTLIKLLVDLKSEPHEKFPTPVVGAPAKDVPTSEDVHLYLDPDSSMSVESQAPLLFADCEGLEGGERDPIGARLKKKLERGSGANHSNRQLRHTSERELVWADEDRKKSRGFAVGQLYPRLLYTFSDVIVFVLKNPRVIERVLERLVEWAQAALEKSSNQPILPHAIIALNACENDTPEDLWDVETATHDILASLSKTVYQNTTFKGLAQFWKERDRQVDTVEELLLSYYSSIHVVRIPRTGRPNLIQRQVEKLSEKIRLASKQARERKLELRMLLDADEFQPYLQAAFDHFAQDLNTPFDFVQASFANSPIPNDFGGNILKLALHVMDRWTGITRGETIFEELSYVVASCIMLDAARSRNKGNPDAIFPMYLEHIDNALENFCDRHWPCEFIGKGGGRCVNVRSGHGAKGHQLKSGKLLGAGEYFSTFTFDWHKSHFEGLVYYKLVSLYERVRKRARETYPPTSEERAAADIHRELVLPHFFEHASKGDPQAFMSHTVCFCCLFEPPEHALPCGHIICTTCLRTYGKVHRNRYVEIAECPMEKRQRFSQTWRVYLKPTACGVRILTLDGGGVRGIVELEILRAVEEELGSRIGIQHFFDLIVGTSTGGIIALGLTAGNLTVEECIKTFESLCWKAFTQRKGSGVPGLGWLVENYHHSRYTELPLQEALISTFGDSQYLFGGRRSDQRSMDVKVAVTATSAAGHAVVLANYNRFCLEKLPYSFQRPENLDAELKTWEAARATSAAPKYFKPLVHGPSKQVYLDGGIYHNNPINIADHERKLLWPAIQEEEPDLILSIGTLYCNSTKEKRATLRSQYTSTGIIAHGRHLTKVASDHLHSALDSEKTWREYVNVRKPGENKGRYIRINPQIQEPPPKLDAKEQMKKLQKTTRHLISDDPQIKVLARRIVASCFYFEMESDVKEDINVGVFTVSGYFHCRFMDGFEIAALGRFIKNGATAGHDPHFLIKEEGNEDSQPQEVRFDPTVLDRMIHRQVFRMERLEIRRSTRQSRTEIFLCLTRDSFYPISGFPRRLHAEKGTLQANRHVLTSTHSFRWAGRSISQQQRRVHWKPPGNLPRQDNSDVIGSYSDTNHLLQNYDLDEYAREQLDGRAYSELESTLTPNPRYELPVPALITEQLARPPLAELRSTTSYIELPTTEARSDNYYTVFQDWTGRNSNCLNVVRGDLVKIIRKGDDGFWLCQRPHDDIPGWLDSEVLVLAPPDSHNEYSFRELNALIATNERPASAN